MLKWTSNIQTNQPEYRDGFALLNMYNYKVFSITDEYWLLQLDWMYRDRKVVKIFSQMSSDNTQHKIKKFVTQVYTLPCHADRRLWFSWDYPSSKNKFNSEMRKNEMTNIKIGASALFCLIEKKHSHTSINNLFNRKPIWSCFLQCGF